jgi:hypothetical protein
MTCVESGEEVQQRRPVEAVGVEEEEEEEEVEVEIRRIPTTTLPPPSASSWTS